MSQQSPDVYSGGTAPGSTTMPNILDCLNAIMTSNSGATEPSYKVTGTVWWDTSGSGELKVYDGAAWIDYDVVTVAAANKILRLNGSSKLPADITGDADTVDGIHAASSATANQLLALDGSAKLPADITGDADTLDGYHAADLLGGSTVIDAFGVIAHPSTNYTITTVLDETVPSGAKFVSVDGKVYLDHGAGERLFIISFIVDIENDKLHGIMYRDSDDITKDLARDNVTIVASSDASSMAYDSAGKSLRFAELPSDGTIELEMYRYTDVASGIFLRVIFWG